MPSKASLTEGPIRQTLIKLTIPMIFGLLGMVSFNLIDAFFVGQLGAQHLAAISFTFPVVLIVTAGIASGLGVGAVAVVSRAIGEGDRNKIQHLTTDALSLSVLIVGVFVFLGFLTLDLFFPLLGATPDVMPLIKEYMNIYYATLMVSVIPIVGTAIIRATGDTKTASTIMLISVGINIILDPFMIFGIWPFPRMELAGAALATAIARTVLLVMTLWVLHVRDHMISFQIPKFKAMLRSWSRILYIGLPTAGTNLIVPVGTTVLMSIVATYGPEAVAAFGVASRVEMLALVVIMALGSVVGPFVGQNWGAEKIDRMRLGIRYGQQFALGWGGLMVAVLALAAYPIAFLFNDDPNVISAIVVYLWIAPFGYGFQGVLMVSTASFNVLNKPMNTAALTVARVFLFNVPFAYLGSILFGLPGVFGAPALANLIVGTTASFWLKRLLAGPLLKDPS